MEEEQAAAVAQAVAKDQLNKPTTPDLANEASVKSARALHEAGQDVVRVGQERADRETTRPRGHTDMMIQTTVEGKIHQDLRGWDGSDLRAENTEAETAKVNVMNQEFRIQQQIIERGFETLSPEDKALVIERILHATSADARLAPILEGMSVEEKNQFVAAVASRESFENSLNLNQDEFLTMAAAVEDLDPAVVAEYTHSQVEVNDTQRDIAEAQHRLNLANIKTGIQSELQGAANPGALDAGLRNRQNEFVTQGGALRTEIADLNARLATVPPQERENLQRQIDQRQLLLDLNDQAGTWMEAFRVDVLQGGGPPGGPVPADWETRRDNQGFDVDTQRDDARQDVQDLTQYLNQVANPNLRTARTNYDYIVGERKRAEQALVDRMGSNYGRAAQEYLNRQYEYFDNQYNTNLLGTRGGTENSTQNRFDRWFKERFHIHQDTRFLGIRRTKDKDVRSEIDSFMGDILEGNVNAAMERLVPGDLPPAERLAIINSPQYRQLMIDRVVHLKMRNGGISENQVHNMVETDWGKSAITNALRMNGEAANAYKQILKDNVAKGEFFSWLAGRDNKTLWYILTAIFLGVGGAALAASGVGLVGAAGGAAAYSGVRGIFERN